MEFTIGRLLIALLILVFYNQPVVAETNHNDELSMLVKQLAGAKLKKISLIVAELEQNVGERSLPIFEALLAGKLYYRKRDKKIIIVVSGPESPSYIVDALSARQLGAVNKKEIKKVKTNNRIRAQVKVSISRLNLASQDIEKRKLAVIQMLNRLTESDTKLLIKARRNERNTDILAYIDVAIALQELGVGTVAQKYSALTVLEGSLEPAVRNQLRRSIEKNNDGAYLEPDAQVRKRIRALLERIESRVAFYHFIEKLFFGLSLGSVLLLVATGLAITFGVMGVINMAHGELIMLGAYCTYVIQLLLPDYISYSIFIAIPVAFLVSGGVGILIERGVIRFLHGRPLETLLATFGVSLVLQQTVRTIFSPLNRQVETPLWMSGSLEINPVLSLTLNRIYILLFAIAVFILLQLILKKTNLGLYVRAVSQNRAMAKAIGIKTGWVDALTFGLGSGIAGVAGVALSQLTNVGPNLGQSYIIDSFMVVVFGGVGNLWGTLVGGFSLGLVNKFLEPATGAVLANILVLVFIILFIQKRPRGLFPQKGRAAES